MTKLWARLAGGRKVAALMAGIVLFSILPAGGITAEAHGRGHGGCHGGGHHYQENQRYYRSAEVQPATDTTDWEDWICPREDCPYLVEGFNCHEAFSAGCSAAPEDCSCYYHHCIGGGCGVS